MSFRDLRCGQALLLKLGERTRSELLHPCAHNVSDALSDLASSAREGGAALTLMPCPRHLKSLPIQAAIQIAGDSKSLIRKANGLFQPKYHCLERASKVSSPYQIARSDRTGRRPIVFGRLAGVADRKRRKKRTRPDLRQEEQRECRAAQARPSQLPPPHLADLAGAQRLLKRFSDQPGRAILDCE